MQAQQLYLKQDQRQKLSPQMIQSIRLMALPLIELKDEIQHELENNPALEILEDHSMVSLDTIPEEKDSESEQDSFFENTSDSGFSKKWNDDDSKRMFLEGAISMPETLQDHLIWQLMLQPVSEQLRSIAENLIHNLDADGFHKEDPYILCKNENIQMIDEAMLLVRNFEPVGVCVKDYKESLVVQAKLDPDVPPYTEEVINNFLDLLEKEKYSDIQKSLKLDSVSLDKIVKFIRKLNPFPGRLFSAKEVRFVLPDVMIKLRDSEFVIVLNDEEIPVLGINPFFDQLSTEKHDRNTDMFVKENIRKARFFINSIHQRNKTLVKVVQAIVEYQRAFFSRGPKYLAPLALKDVASEIGVHETTVSRIANKKYIQTDWGIFELRYFFTNSISGAGSSRSIFSKEGVKQIIREIIQNEESALADKEIVEMLSRKGIKLARRTVSKYRLELNMESSFYRKRSKL